MNLRTAKRLTLLAAAAYAQFACDVTVHTVKDNSGEDSGARDASPAASSAKPDAATSTPTTTASVDTGVTPAPDASASDAGDPNDAEAPRSDAGDGAVNDASVSDGAVDGSAGDDGSARDGGSAADLCEYVYTACLDENTLVTCAAPGAEPSIFTCTDGCDDSIEVATCQPLVLDNGWFVHQFDLADDSIQTEAAYAFSEGGLVAVQTQNPMASVYVKDEVLSNVMVTGSISVTTASDDDYFGFVFGWQDPEHFYLLDWKQSQQNDSTCGLAEEGFALKVVDSDTALTNCVDLWASAGSTKVTPLVAASENPTGWEENVTYDFTLVYKPGDIQVTIKQGDTVVAELSSADSTYASGRFGFYNYSQEGVRYEFFRINPAAE